jgi:glycosyltransferase involved in cell wall biosynthesis
MRLLYLSPTASMGGAERVLLDLLIGIRRARPTWVLGLIVANDGPLVEEARRLGVKTTILPFPRAFARLGDAGLSGAASWIGFAGRAVVGSVAMAAYLRRFRAALQRFNPDLVHSNGFKMHLVGALTKPPHATLLWHFHDYVGARRVTSRMIQRVNHRCQAIIAVSESVAADIRRQLGPSTDVTTVWNSVNFDRFKPEGPRLDLDAFAGLLPAPTGSLRVGLVATFARWKGHLLFLEVLRRLIPSHRIRGYMIGGPVYETVGSQISREELRTAISRAGLTGRVGLTGFVRDASTALRGLDIVVHASTSPEPFGLVVAEAMAVGRPVVVSDAGGVAELVRHEHNALTYEAGEPDALARQIERLITDSALRQRLGQAARLTAIEQFGPSRCVEQILGVYSRFERRVAA